MRKRFERVKIEQEYGPLSLEQIERLADIDGFNRIKRLSYELILLVYQELKEIGLVEFEIKYTGKRDLLGCARMIERSSDKTKAMYKDENQQRLAGRNYNFSCLGI